MMTSIPPALNSPTAPHGPQQDPSTLSPLISLLDLSPTWPLGHRAQVTPRLSVCTCGPLPLEGPWPLWPPHGPLWSLWGLRGKGQE